MRPVSKTPPPQTLPGVTRADSIAAPAAEGREETAVWRIALRVAAGILGLLALAIHPAIFLPAGVLFVFSFAQPTGRQLGWQELMDMHDDGFQSGEPLWDQREMERNSRI